MTPNSDSSTQGTEKKTFDLVDSLADSLSDIQQRLILKVLLHSGIYLRELIWLRSRDIDLKNAAIQIRKASSQNKRERAIKIPEWLAADLARFSKPAKPYLFHSPLLPRLNERYVQRILGKYSLRWGLKLTPKRLQRLYRQRQIAKKKGSTSFGLKRFDEKKAADEGHLASVLSSIKDPRSKIIIGILAECGLFASELLLLQQAHIDFLQNQIMIPGKRSRTVDISATLSANIYSYCQENRLSGEDYLLSRKKAPLSTVRLGQILSKLSDSKHKVTARSLRYRAYLSFFKNLSQAGAIHQSGVANLTKFHLFGVLAENEQ